MKDIGYKNYYKNGRYVGVIFNGDVIYEGSDGDGDVENKEVSLERSVVE